VQLRPPRGLLLDLDETLFDNSFVPLATQPACEAVASSVPSIDQATLTAAFKTASDEYWPEVGPRTLTGELDALDISREVWRRALGVCGCDDARIVDAAHDNHQQRLADMSRPFDDVPEFIDAITAVGIPMALVTNGSPALQRAKLKGIGLDHAFTAIVISGDLGTVKPDPIMFTVAVERLGLTVADVWHVGDSLHGDVAGARAAGIRSVWLNRSGAPRSDADPNPDVEIHSLIELVPLVSARGAGT
jgi:putative hydrolase of the HAD superfamily